MKGGPATGPSPVDSGKTGGEHHVIVEARGIPVAVRLTGGNRDDVAQVDPSGPSPVVSSGEGA